MISEIKNLEPDRQKLQKVKQKMEQNMIPNKRAFRDCWINWELLVEMNEMFGGN